MQWAKKEEKIYLLLSSEGKLYRGHGQSQANYVMDNVDAGKFMCPYVIDRHCKS